MINILELNSNEELKHNVMKNLLYVIAALLIVIWIIVVKPSSGIHLLLAVAGLLIVIRMVFDKQLSRK